MSNNIIINSTNIVSKSNNKFKYTMPREMEFKKGDKIAISHLNVYYSIFNITQKYNNNKFFYKWWDMNGDLTVLVEVKIPDGFYSVNTLFEFLQREMVNNGHYLETVSGNYIYFIELLTNSTYYSTEIRLSSLSTMMELENGLQLIVDNVNPALDYVKKPTTWKIPDYVDPNGIANDESSFQCPEVIIPSNNNFGKLLGFNAGTIQKDLSGSNAPDKNGQYSFLNDFTPNMNPSSSYIVTCNLVDNQMSIPNDVLYSFTIPSGIDFADLISPENDVIYAKMKEGRFRDINLTIYDQDFNEVQILDDNILIVLSIVQKEE